MCLSPSNQKIFVPAAITLACLILNNIMSNKQGKWAATVRTCLTNHTAGESEAVWLWSGRYLDK